MFNQAIAGEMVEQNFLNSINPLIKIIALIVVTVLITFDYKPYLPAMIIVTCFIAVWILASNICLQFLKAVYPFLFLACGFILFTMITRGIKGEMGEYTFWLFSWTEYDLTLALALGLRILAIIVSSICFIMTTNPVDLTVALIKYFRLPPALAYSALAAYRFLPTIREEIESIRFAHEIRGVNSSGSMLEKIRFLKVYPIPLLAAAVRRGERVALAMEARAFSSRRERTYYRSLQFTKKDIGFLVVFLVYIITVVVLFHKLGISYFSLGFDI